MKMLLRVLQWALKAILFLALLAFALNNQHLASVHFFFGTQWRAPMVLVVLLSFGTGLVLGLLVMAPRWWRQRSAVAASTAPESMGAQTVGAASAAAVSPPHPPAVQTWTDLGSAAAVLAGSAVDPLVLGEPKGKRS